MEAEARFPVMGTSAHVVVVGGDVGDVEAARARLDDLEARWSRFRPTSEVSLMNVFAGRPVRVSPVTALLVERACEGAALTGGRFDPTVLGDVVRAGYDRTFVELGDATTDGVSELRRGVAGIRVDRAASMVRLPDGVGFDPGGIGKGLAADLVVEELVARGLAGAMVNVGGDLRAAGESPTGDGWTVGLAHPFVPRAQTVVGVGDGAVATSMRTRRVWGPAGDRRHHLIDPGSGRAATTGVASVSVIAAEAWQAEVVAKAAFLAGVAEGLVVLAATGTDGVIVDDAGIAYPSAGLDRFMGRAATPAAAAGTPAA